MARTREIKANQVSEAAAEQVLDERQLQYLDWLCDPQRVGTKEQQAERFGVVVSTLYRWTKMPVFRKAWDKRVQDLAGDPDRLQNVYDVLYAKALGGDTKAAELYLKAVGKLQQTATVEVAAKDPNDLSDEELDALIAQQAEVQRTQRALQAVR